ncbi:MAG: response regulator transcription factor [Eggerthellaceae bacterium]|nr:response regulator transcription factor [Eggerthellaceae bacterium]
MSAVRLVGETAMVNSAELNGSVLAAVLRRRTEEISSEVRARYVRYYAHSVNADIDESFANEWNLRELNDFLDCIAADGRTNGNFAAWVGDAAATHFAILSPLYNRLDMVLLYSEVCVSFLWEEYVGDAARLNEAVAVFERCVGNLLAADAAAYFDAKLAPGSLEKTWKLGPHSETTPISAGQQSPAVDLSRRQLQLVRFVAEGRSNGEIAAELGISANTVKNHLAAIFDKLNVNNRTELALRATRDGLLD